jgi:hypothetical protein
MTLPVDDPISLTSERVIRKRRSDKVSKIAAADPEYKALQAELAAITNACQVIGRVRINMMAEKEVAAAKKQAYLRKLFRQVQREEEEDGADARSREPTDAGVGE